MQENAVIVVTICETLLEHADEVDTVVFSDWDKANAWIESQIDEKVKDFQLDRDSDVNGWFVHIDAWDHTIQYDAKERVVQ